MGVKDLWRLLGPVGTPVSNTDTLEGNVLAVDISILLHKALHGYRDSSGSAVPNAHIQSLFQKICKLLYMKVKPVFVFDGGVPELKKKTMAARQSRRHDASDESKQLHEKILRNYVKFQALKATKMNTGSDVSSGLVASSSQPDIYELPPIPDKNHSPPSDSEPEADEQWEEMANLQTIMNEYQDLNHVDIDSEDVRNLPPEIQHELISDMKDIRRQYSFNRECPESSEDFSKFQLKNLLKRSRLTVRLTELEKEMNNRASGEIVLEIGQDASEVQSRRIVSDDTTHYILIKGLSNNTQPDLLTKIYNISQDKSNVVKLKENAPDKDISDQSLNNTYTEHNDTHHGLPRNLPLISEVGDMTHSPVGIFTDDKDIEETSKKTDVEYIQISSSRPDTDEKPLSKTADQEISELGAIRTNDKEVEIDKAMINNTCNVASTTQATAVSLTGDIIVSDSESDEFIEVDENEAASSELLMDHSIDNKINTLSHADTLTTTDNRLPVEQTDEMTTSLDIEEAGEGDSEAGEDDSDEEDAWKGWDLDDVNKLEQALTHERVSLRSEKGRRERAAASLSDAIYHDCKEMLRMFGLPFVTSPLEAEAQCAFFDDKGMTDGSITDDSDIWLFGAKKVYKNFFSSDQNMEYYRSDLIEKSLHLNRNKMICLAMLVGSDYTCGVANVGRVTAMEILQEFHIDEFESLKMFKEWWLTDKTMQENSQRRRFRRFQLNEGFPSEAVFEAYSKPTVDSSLEPFEWGSPDLDLIREFIGQKLGWTPERTDKDLLPVLKRLNSPSKSQVILDEFFTPAVVPSTKHSKTQSKRLKRVFARLANPDIDPGPDDHNTSNKSRQRCKKTVPKRRCKMKKNKSDGPKLSESSSDSDDTNV